MTESVSFKTYLKRDGQDVEVRRFGVDSGAASSFMYLRSKIQAMFPSIQNDQFTVFWQDNDKDYIAIGSDEELLEALTSGMNQPFKLFVNITTEQPEQGTHEQPQLHAGVMCDSCNQQIVGFRYKCVTCPDFDLCATCEAACKHSEHFMLRMPFPLGAASCHPKFFRKVFSHPHKFRRWARNSMNPQGAGVSGGRCPFSRRDGPAPPPASGVTDMFDFSALMEFINSMTGIIPGQANEPAANAQTSANSQTTPGNQSGSQESRAPRQTGVDYLNGIGQAITAILDPFGVDVTFDVRHPTSRPEETPVVPQQTASTPETSVPTSSSIPTSSQLNVSTSTQQSTPITVQQNVPVTSQPSASSPVSIGESSPTSENQPTPAREATPLVARRNSDDWTVISRESPTRSEVAMEVDESRAAKSSGTETITPAPTAPPAPQASASSLDPERQRIQEAINNIRSMGFNYETKILRELLRQENGDIASVLETILNNSGKK